MKNILDQSITHDPFFRLEYSADFVDDHDLQNKKILDIGCGFGWFEFNALKRGANAVVATEVSEEDLKNARAAITSLKVIFCAKSALNLSFEQETFDTVVFWEVLEHLPGKNEEFIFAKIRQFLKPGGVLYLSTPHGNFFSILFDPAWWLVGHRHYSRKDIADFAGKNGFKIEKLAVRGRWWEIAAIFNLYVAKWVFRRQPFFSDYFRERLRHEYKNNGFCSLFCKLKAI